jgi:hypothetical protein
MRRVPIEEKRRKRFNPWKIANIITTVRSIDQVATRGLFPPGLTVLAAAWWILAVILAAMMVTAGSIWTTRKPETSSLRPPIVATTTVESMGLVAVAASANLTVRPFALRIQSSSRSSCLGRCAAAVVWVGWRPLGGNTHSVAV